MNVLYLPAVLYVSGILGVTLLECARIEYYKARRCWVLPTISRNHRLRARSFMLYGMPSIYVFVQTLAYLVLEFV